MRFVATLIGPIPGSLTEAHVAAARDALAPLGAAAAPPDWLAEGEAADLVFDALDPDQADAAIRQSLEGAAIDCIAQPVENRRKKLLIADMESTIIEQEMLDEIADLRGIKPQIAAITARAMNGEIDFTAALNERVALLAGLKESEIEALMRLITFMPGAEALVRTMRRDGARTLLVSGGFTIFAERVASSLGFDLVRANVLEFSGKAGSRVLTGKVVPPVRDRTDKLDQLMQQAGRYRIPLIETVAVGDGANDVPMLQAAGLGVAFHAKPSVKAAVRARVDHAGLLALLFAQGYRLSEIVT
jgi:phosphoserine phosphatase